MYFRNFVVKDVFVFIFSKLVELFYIFVECYDVFVVYSMVWMLLNFVIVGCFVGCFCGIIFVFWDR